ncbi:DsbA family protein [Spirosoma sp. KNUC1025]|uniref:DsbA family protein n=1 Tax=Spirosoma sp. KNUC1025 TaxID=2894082 RepID=UPI003863AA02|nr:hypothetical protein LN737_17195 [Spirosoma sp. KNUC1025]
MDSFNKMSVSNSPVAGAVELVEFGDALCHRSQHVRKAISAILDQFNGQPLTYAYRHYPDPANTQSILAAVAAEAASRQGKLWPMYTALCTQPLINCATLGALALTLELDQSRFFHDLLDDHVYSRVTMDWRAGHLFRGSLPIDALY